MIFYSDNVYSKKNKRLLRIGCIGYVADNYKTLKCIVECENKNCYGKLTKIPGIKYPKGFEIDHDGMIWKFFYLVGV